MIPLCYVIPFHRHPLTEVNLILGTKSNWLHWLFSCMGSEMSIQVRNPHWGVRLAKKLVVAVANMLNIWLKCGNLMWTPFNIFSIGLICIMKSNQISINVNSGNTACYDRRFLWYWVILCLLCFVIFSTRFFMNGFWQKTCNLAFFYT